MTATLTGDMPGSAIWQTNRQADGRTTTGLYLRTRRTTTHSSGPLAIMRTSAAGGSRVRVQKATLIFKRFAQTSRPLLHDAATRVWAVFRLGARIATRGSRRRRRRRLMASAAVSRRRQQPGLVTVMHWRLMPRNADGQRPSVCDRHDASPAAAPKLSRADDRMQPSASRSLQMNVRHVW